MQMCGKEETVAGNAQTADSVGCCCDDNGDGGGVP